MKKANPPPAYFPYQRPVSVNVHPTRIAYTSDRLNSAFEIATDVPSIKLEGDWLEEAGFYGNSVALVTVEKDCLVIKPELKHQRPK